MSVLAAAFSVVISVETLNRKYPGGAIQYARDCPNQTFCSDGLLTRVGLMTTDDMLSFVRSLEHHGLVS